MILAGVADTFGRDFWDEHWRAGASDGAMSSSPPNPQLVAEVGSLAPGTALEAGAGAGAEASWLAARGWQVTAADISAEALARAAGRFADGEGAARVEWLEADLSSWDPGRTFDLVTTHYAHPSIGQLAFYDRLASWVAPGGTLLIVGHASGDDQGDDYRDDHGDRPASEPGPGHEPGHGHGHGHAGGRHRPPAEASVTAAAVVARLGEGWRVITAEERRRTLSAADGRAVELRDVVVRAVRDRPATRGRVS